MSADDKFGWIVAAGLTALVLWTLRAGKRATDAFATGIADIIAKWKFPEPVQVSGAMLMPDGRIVSMNDIVQAGGVKKVPGQEIFYFDYQSRRYHVVGRTEQGNYVARLA